MLVNQVWPVVWIHSLISNYSVRVTLLNRYWFLCVDEGKPPNKLIAVNISYVKSTFQYYICNK